MSGLGGTLDSSLKHTFNETLVQQSEKPYPQPQNPTSWTWLQVKITHLGPRRSSTVLDMGAEPIFAKLCPEVFFSTNTSKICFFDGVDKWLEIEVVGRSDEVWVEVNEVAGRSVRGGHREVFGRFSGVTAPQNPHLKPPLKPHMTSSNQLQIPIMVEVDTCQNDE